MKAVVRTRYGPPDVVRVTEVEKPTPKENEVLIEVHAASVNPVDLFQLQGAPVLCSLPGMRKPKQQILGCDIAGRLESVGGQVKKFQRGDEVFGVTGFGGGGFAEYVCSVEDRLTLKPENVLFEEAAGVPVAGITALQGLRDQGHIQPGQKVLIDGASGGVGTFAVQIAKSFGAEVTAVCGTKNIETARTLGADHVIDYKCVDFTKSEQRYDVILGVNAYQGIFDYWRALEPKGIYVTIGGGIPQIFQALLLGPLLSKFGGKKSRFFVAKVNHKDLELLGGLLAAGKIRCVIDRQFSLGEAAEALRYLKEHHARGKIVIRMESRDS